MLSSPWLNPSSVGEITDRVRFCVVIVAFEDIERSTDEVEIEFIIEEEEVEPAAVKTRGLNRCEGNCEGQSKGEGEDEGHPRLILMNSSLQNLGSGNLNLFRLSMFTFPCLVKRESG